ncbi:tail fiber assembly protein [Serratia phage vB_SmaM-ChuuTotoro]|nr:tail fiber assembly protein [Serratia phage vB_SmaM-ChuuTotoro]
MEYFFSATTGLFYPAVLRESYERAGTWPSDSTHVPDHLYQKFSVTPPPNMILGAGNDGFPAWVEDKKATFEELEASATRRVSKETARALQEIQVLQIADEFDDEGDEHRIFSLKRYINNLRKINRQPAYPAKIIWPEYP